MVLSHRLQLLLDEERYERVAEAAKRQRISVAAVIREAIDRALAPSDERRAAAASSILTAAPMDVPTVDELVTELDELRACGRAPEPGRPPEPGRRG